MGLPGNPLRPGLAGKKHGRQPAGRAVIHPQPDALGQGNAPEHIIEHQHGVDPADGGVLSLAAIAAQRVGSKHRQKHAKRSDGSPIGVQQRQGGGDHLLPRLQGQLQRLAPLGHGGHIQPDFFRMKLAGFEQLHHPTLTRVRGPFMELESRVAINLREADKVTDFGGRDTADEAETMGPIQGDRQVLRQHVAAKGLLSDPAGILRLDEAPCAPKSHPVVAELIFQLVDVALQCIGQPLLDHLGIAVHLAIHQVPGQRPPQRQRQQGPQEGGPADLASSEEGGFHGRPGRCDVPSIPVPGCFRPLRFRPDRDRVTTIRAP